MDNGRLMIDYNYARVVQGWRVGDTLRMCVVALPHHCPPGDQRGITYRAVNARTGTSWLAADSLHSCGGA